MTAAGKLKANHLQPQESKEEEKKTPLKGLECGWSVCTGLARAQINVSSSKSLSPIISVKGNSLENANPDVPAVRRQWLQPNEFLRHYRNVERLDVLRGLSAHEGTKRLQENQQAEVG